MGRTVSVVDVAMSGAVATVVIDRPRAVNAIDEYVLRSLDAAWEGLEEGGRVRAVVLTGAGDRAFCGGSDIRAMREMSVAEGRAFIELAHAVLGRIAESALTTVAAVGGAALGGGAVLALTCDLRIASDRAVLGFPEVRLGLVPGWGGTQRAARLMGPSRAKLLMLTGDRIPAREALRLGLVDEVVPAGALLALARTVAEAAA